MSANGADRTPSTDGSGTYENVGGCVVRRVAEETLVVPIRSTVGDLDSIWVLNETAAFIRALLEKPSGLDEIVAAVTTAFDVEPSKAREEVLGHLRALEEAGLVRHLPSTREGT